MKQWDGMRDWLSYVNKHWEPRNTGTREYGNETRETVGWDEGLVLRYINIVGAETQQGSGKEERFWEDVGRKPTSPLPPVVGYLHTQFSVHIT